MRKINNLVKVPKCKLAIVHLYTLFSDETRSIALSALLGFIVFEHSLFLDLTRTFTFIAFIGVIAMLKLAPTVTIRTSITLPGPIAR